MEALKPKTLPDVKVKERKKHELDPMKIGKLEVEQMGFLHLNIYFPLIDDVQ